ncbi:MAG: hypothetical protein GY898_06630 [Proteobacteria bacterium]|nr:hypothetical protein [Pseudomonadota bacterium]
MGLLDFLKLGVSDFFTTSKTREIRRQCAFHIKNAEKFQTDAFQDDEAAWEAYFEELAKAIAADTSTIEARYLRAKALLYWFEHYRGRSPHDVRDYARAWDRDLKFMLTHWPDEDPEGMTLRSTREIREEFERHCRGLGLG